MHKNQMQYTRKELLAIGFGTIGKDVVVSKPSVFYNPEKIHIGNNVRIDSFSLISAGEKGVHIGNYVHIASGVMIFGSSAKVTIMDYVGISARVCIYTGSDDFRNGFISVPTVPSRYRKVFSGDVILGRHSLVGAGSIVLPGVTMDTGGTAGALSLVKENVKSFTIVAGCPAKKIGTRHDRVLDLEKKFRRDRENKASK